MAIDPVCKREVDEITAEYRSEHKGEIYSFCASVCKDVFEMDPEKFLRDEKRHWEGSVMGDTQTRHEHVLVNGLGDIQTQKTLKAWLSNIEGLEKVSTTSEGVTVDYDPAVLSLDSICSIISSAGFQWEKKQKPRNPVKRFLNRLAKSNQKNFGSETLDCCQLNKKPNRS